MSGYEISYRFTVRLQYEDGSRVTRRKEVQSDTFGHAFQGLEAWVKNQGAQILFISGLREAA